MAKRSTAKIEQQDPSLPQKQRARRRFIGAGLLALAAIVLLPLALESEPRQAIGGIDVSIPSREDFGRRTQYWPDTSYRQAAATPDEGERSGLFTRAASEAPKLDANRFNPSGSTPVAEEAADGKTDKADADRKIVPVQASEKPVLSANAAAAIAKETKAPPPMPERRTDRNKVEAASPSGYVVQIGAFSSRKGASAQVKRARALGFDAYTEKITTKKGVRIRVRIGPYLNRDQANVAREKLRTKGIETALIAP